MSSPLEQRFDAEAGVFPLTGIQALARLPIDLLRAERKAGRLTRGFISGYEGSPLAGYDLELGRRRALLDEYGIVFRPGVNEELAATAVQGSQLAAAHADRTVDGVIGLWYGKSPGLDRASDAVRHNNLMGVAPGSAAVALVGDDPSAKSSSLPGASERLLADLAIPTLFPSDPQDVLDLGKHAAAMSRASGLWVALKITTDVADGLETVDVDVDRVVPAGPLRAVEHQVSANMLQPTIGILERSLHNVRTPAAVAYAARNGLDRIVRSGGQDRVGIVAAGQTFLQLRQALRTLGLGEDELERRGVRLLKLGMIYPLEPTVITEFASGLSEIVVVEEKRPFLEDAVRSLLYGRTGAPLVTGKRAPDGTALLPLDGELNADLITKGLATRLAQLDGFPTVRTWLDQRRAPRQRIDLPLVTRTPYFCSGCPHNSSTTAIPDGSLIGGGIGCHGLSIIMDKKVVGNMTGLTQMGGEGAQWVGMAPFVRQDHLLQNLGDGTFHHSGSLAVRAAVAGEVNMTYKLLYNSTVAMTGGQDPVGQLTVAQVSRALLAEGVARVIITTEDPGRHRRRDLPRGVAVWHRDRLEEAQRVLAAVPGVTVLIHDQECATELRRKRKRGLVPDPEQRVLINERVCEGCGDCGAVSNCMSVHPTDTEFGRKTKIEQSSCNKDYSCLDGDCPSFLVVTPGKTAVERRTAPDLAPDDLPEPAVPATAAHTIRITGMGGTGVITLSQILATAAALAGRSIRTLDQTGLAQKGGAVVSDIKITESEEEQSNRAAEGEADLYLGCDLLVAADPKYLAAADTERTTAVVSVSKVPTGHMVVDPSASFPDPELLVDRIRSASRARDTVALDARELATTLLGEDQFANMLLAGAAYQKGALALPVERIEEAIRLNGVRVEANIQAFRRGRQAVAAPADLEKTLTKLRGTPTTRPVPEGTRELIARVGAEPGSELNRLLQIRVPDLISYQSREYARDYVDFVERVRLAEAGLADGAGAGELAEAVARYLYKLMAYKDEYEVARLALDPSVEADARAQFGAKARMSYRLHPPMLRALGMKRKISLGPWFKPAFRLLAALRRVRGTPLDLFGYTAVRRMERELVVEYRQTVEALLARLDPKNHALAVEIACLPDLVRGYEEIKIENVRQYREQTGRLRKKLDEEGTLVVETAGR